MRPQHNYSTKDMRPGPISSIYLFVVYARDPHKLGVPTLSSERKRAFKELRPKK